MIFEIPILATQFIYTRTLSTAIYIYSTEYIWANLHKALSKLKQCNYNDNAPNTGYYGSYMYVSLILRELPANWSWSRDILQTLKGIQACIPCRYDSLWNIDPCWQGNQLDLHFELQECHVQLEILTVTGVWGGKPAMTLDEGSYYW